MRHLMCYPILLLVAVILSLTPATGSTGTPDPHAALSIPEVPKPGYLNPIQPEPFGTRIMRIAGDPGTAIAFSTGQKGVWGTDVRHHYSDDQAWNANQTLIALQNYGGGSPSVIYLDGTTYLPKFGRCPNYNLRDDRWHPTLPSIRVNGDGRSLEWFDVMRCVQVRRWALPFPVKYIGLTDGDISRDGRFVALSDGTRMFVVDMDPQPPFAAYPDQRIGPAVTITYSSWAVDFVSISPSGRYAVVHYQGDYNRVYDIDPVTLTLTPRLMPVAAPRCHGRVADGFVYDLGHPDMTLNPLDNNEDVMIGQEHCGNRGKMVNGLLVGGVVMVRLRDGAITSLTDPTNEAYPYHVSTRNFKRPGWAYVSYWERQGGKRFDQEIVSVRLDGGKQVERWVHHRSNSAGCYRCEAHPVPSPDGLRVLFASAWNINCNGRCGNRNVRQAYVAGSGALPPSGAPRSSPPKTP